MVDRIARQLAFVKGRGHRGVRAPLSDARFACVAREIQDTGKPMIERYTRRLELFLEAETPTLLADTEIQIIRTVPSFPDIYAPGEMDEIRKTHFVHEQGKVFNVACDYDAVLREGLEGRRKRLRAGLDTASEDQKIYAGYVERCIDASIRFADRYAELERQSGMPEMGDALARSARTGATTLQEAMQLFRLLHFILWCSGAYHNTVGRFDQFMAPYYESDRAAGRLDREGALALTEDFFLSFNRDADLYPGVMQGDNGQALMLGGCKRDGSPAVNDLTYLAIEASLALLQIDPKLNLRCDANTPDDLYELATKLTRAGMGFPQYASDDVIIPGLVKLGYDLEDARDYTVAACWEFIIPGAGMDIPNIGAVSLAGVTRATIAEGLPKCADFGALVKLWGEKLAEGAKAQNDAIRDLYIEPAPYHSILMTNCMDEKRDISLGGKYNNFGFHGTGFSSAVDQMAAVQKLVYEDGEAEPDRLLAALETNFENEPELWHALRWDAPKLGRDASAKRIAETLIDLYADALAPLRNERGGIVRGGTASAMYYLWHSEHMGATADGRKYGEPLPANFSPALYLTGAGLFSVIGGFTEPNLYRLPNGGPFTLELHDTVFGAPDSVQKVAQMVKAYIRLGGHQMQLNAVNRDALRDAQLHPENHADLVVRVWGWSGRFVELDKPFQDQIIARTEFAM